MRWRRQIWAVGSAAALLLASTALYGEPGDGVPVVRGEVIRDFARVTFEWPQSTYVDARMQGKTLILTFDRQANPDFGKLLQHLSPYVTHAELSGNGKTVRLTLNRPYHIRSFVSGNLNGVDILGIYNKAPAKAARAEKVAELSPAAGSGEEDDATGKADTAPKEKEPAKKTAIKEKAPEQKAAEKASEKKAAEKKSVEKASAEKKSAEKKEDVAKAAEKLAADETSAPHAVKVFASTADNQTVLRFAWPERVASAVFIRNNMLWIVFNKHAALDMEPLKETADSLYSEIMQVEAKDATILRIPTGGNAGAMVSKGKEANEWDVVMLSAPQEPATRLRVDVNTEPPLPPHVFLPVSEAAPPMTLEDPDMGDSLLAIPTYQAGEGVAPQRNFVEFSLLKTAQGLVIYKLADAVHITTVRNGLRIGTDKGAYLSPGMSQQPDQKSQTGQPKSPTGPLSVLFPYEAWKSPYAALVRPQVQALQNSIAMAREPEEAAKLRMELAQLFLAENLNVEALGVLREIQRTSPQFYVSLRGAALAGAANFMLHRFAESSEDFSASELQGNPEVTYWQSVLGELLGKPDQNYDYMANWPTIHRYPPRMKQQLAIVAADRALAKGEYNVTLQILQTMRDDGLINGMEDYAAYFVAKAAMETGKEKDGMAVLTTLASDYKHPDVRARAEFTLLNHELKKRSQTIGDAKGAKSPEDEALLHRLERLYLSWRGDNLELETVKILGELYAEQDDYPRAMRAWRDLISDFPSTVAAAEALNHMRATFVTLFDEGAAASLAPLDQLSLYYEFRSLTPSDEVGDRIVQHITDRLVDMDLLEQAINLLEYRMRYLYEKEPRSRSGAKLAKIYMLNHQPDRALQALQVSVYGENPPDLRAERDRLAAAAMVEVGRYAEAMKLLSTDKTAAAETIRQRAWWKLKQWPKLIASLETEMKNRHDSTAPVTEGEAEMLVHLAAAYGAEGDTTQLQYLRDYFTPLIKDSREAKIFDYLTEADIPATPETFDSLMQQVADTQDFLHHLKLRPDLPQVPPQKMP